MKLEIVVAHDMKKGIGKDGQLAWHLPKDLAYFKTLTTTVEDGTKQNIVIMGRKTYESIPEKFRPLPGRLNVVLSSKAASDDKAVFLDSWEACLAFAQEKLNQGSIERVFVIGGASVYEQALKSKEIYKIWLTKVYGEYQCDTFFPDIVKREWEGVYGSNIFVMPENINCAFVCYQKRSLTHEQNT